MTWSSYNMCFWMNDCNIKVHSIYRFPTHPSHPFWGGSRAYVSTGLVLDWPCMLRISTVFPTTVIDTAYASRSPWADAGNPPQKNCNVIQPEVPWYLLPSCKSLESPLRRVVKHHKESASTMDARDSATIAHRICQKHRELLGNFFHSLQIYQPWWVVLLMWCIQCNII